METIARCNRDHLFVTTWVLGGTRSVRLGPRTRLQRCPVGDHWAIVHAVKEEDLTLDERRAAAAATASA
jgi:hypothetical protein